MCYCTPSIRTPCCGAVDCVPKENSTKIFDKHKSKITNNIVNLEIKSQISDVNDILKECLDMSDGLQSVIVLGLFKDSSQMLRTSTMSAMEKAFLAQFLNAWMTQWFRLDGDNE